MHSPVIFVVAGFLVALLCTPAGVSGAFLLLPLQVSVLGLASSSATASNLLYNVVSTPGGIARYQREGKLDGRLARLVISGSLPGVALGAVLRVSVFRSPAVFKAFVGIVLLGLASKLAIDVWTKSREQESAHAANNRTILAVSAAVGVIGGIYGIGGGAILAPYLVAMAGLSAHRVSGAALVATFVTSVVGVFMLVLLSLGPDWGAGFFLGIGGLAGSYVGAALQPRLPEAILKVLIAVLAAAAGVAYLVSYASSA